MDCVVPLLPGVTALLAPVKTQRRAQGWSEATRAAPGPPPGLFVPAHGDVLGLQVLADALKAALAAETGLLDAAERRRGVGHDALVEADHARFDALAHPERAAQIARV